MLTSTSPSCSTRGRRWDEATGTVFREMVCVSGHVTYVYVCVPAWLLVGAEYMELQQPLLGCHIRHNAFFPTAICLRFQPLQFTVSGSISTPASCGPARKQTKGRKTRSGIPADAEIIFHEFISH